MLDLAMLLRSEGIDPKTVLALRHRPTEPDLRRIIGWLAEEEPDTYNMYQRSHGPRTESALLQAKWVASFLGHEAGRAVFAGLYAMNGAAMRTRDDFLALLDHRRLVELGGQPWDEAAERQSCYLFDLELVDALKERKGKLVVDWPKPDRSWFRWCDPARNIFPVRAIVEDSLLAADMPPWDKLVLTWNQLKALPRGWRAQLAAWRGVYFIFDGTDGRGYVGSAYGSDNILGRWLNYAASGHGGNALLLSRRPETFLFSILQRLSPGSSPDEVIAIESSWKTRLHTRAPHGLNAN